MQTAADVLKRKVKPPKVAVDTKATIATAIQKMIAADVGAVLVEDTPGQVVGLLTERDLLKSYTLPGFDPNRALVGDYMQTKLFRATHDTPLIKLEEMFLGLFTRHIIIFKDDRFWGLLSMGDVLRASLLEKDKELKKLNKIASWQYYENWGWDRSKG